MSPMDRTTYFAGNTWQESSTGERIKVESPVNHETVGYAVLGSQADIDVAVTAARDAFDNGPWPRMSCAERADWLEKLADAMERRGADIASTVTAEIGQPMKVSHPWAAIRPLAHLRYYAEALRNRSPEEEVASSSRPGTSIVRREHLGVAALIVPWNHPLASTTLKLAPALAAGCTVVIKPSPETPLSIFN